MTSKKIEDGGPAFPLENVGIEFNAGMSLRDWFAGKILSSTDWSESDVREISDEDLIAMCGQIYRIADAMLIARKAGEA